MTRKLYPSDKKTTTVRVMRRRLRLIRTAAKKEQRPIITYVENTLAAGMGDRKEKP